MSGNPQPVVVVEHVAKSYGGGRGEEPVRAVDDVSFEIVEGETLGLVGESGSGKSTLARLLLGLEEPDRGSVTIAGDQIVGQSARRLRSMRRNMQIVLQDPVGSLNRRKTVSEIIEWPLRIHRVGSRATRRARVRELLGLVGLDPSFANRYPSLLSGGQCQRVSIARALALEPRVLLLDEAVSALDVSVRAQILNLLRDLRERLGLTYLFISHDLAVVRYMAPTIAVMQSGKIVELASRDRIFTRPEHPYTKVLIDAIPRIAPVAGPGRPVSTVDRA